MKTIWLVDYENAQAQGLTKIAAKRSDEVVIGYTDNSPKVPLDALAALGTKTTFLKAEKGNQSLDLCVATEIGRLAATRSRNVRFVIVSDDKGYDHLTSFWAERGRVVERFAPETTLTKTDAEKTRANAAKKPRTPSTKFVSRDYNATVMKRLAKLGIDSKEVGKIASVAMKAMKSGKSEAEKKKTFLKTFGAAKGARYYAEVSALA